MNRIAPILFSLLLIVSAVADEHGSATGEIAAQVRAEFDGERALATVAYLDQHIRWPGNKGFNASIDHIRDELEASGFVNERHAHNQERLVYRIEAYQMDGPAWEPLDAAVHIVGSDVPVLEFATNRNMLARRSHATPDGGVTAELVYAGAGSAEDLDRASVRNKIVMVDWNDTPISHLVTAAVLERGAAGVLIYDLPTYLQPEVNRDSIQFRSLQADVSKQGVWSISLSLNARERLLAALAEGSVEVTVNTRVRWDNLAVERTVVADIHGSEYRNERFVFSAHVQEPGANDNASGVGAQLEMARVAARLMESGAIDPKRTITFLWGDEMVSTHRFVTQDKERAKGIRWGMALDMVGEDTRKTGGTFLIEKMPDPSAIWTRGSDEHSEWGGEPLEKKDMVPHYFNDIVLGRALEQAATNGWVVKTNPFEGGSDHVPFLEAGIPGLLLWHFTDQFYHTDRDRLDKVSPSELANSGVTALVTALALTSADADMARQFVSEVEMAAIDRISRETELSVAAVSDGAAVAEQLDIVNTWIDWYDAALESMSDIEVAGSSPEVLAAIQDARDGLRFLANEKRAEISNVNSM